MGKQQDSKPRKSFLPKSRAEKQWEDIFSSEDGPKKQTEEKVIVIEEKLPEKKPVENKPAGRKSTVLKELCEIIELSPGEKLAKQAKDKRLCRLYAQNYEDIVLSVIKFMGIGYYHKAAEEIELYLEELAEAKEDLADVVSAMPEDEKECGAENEYCLFLEEQIKFAYSGIGNEAEYAKKRAEVKKLCTAENEVYEGELIKAEYEKIVCIVKEFVEKESGAEEYLEFGRRLLTLLDAEESCFKIVFYEDADDDEKINFKLASSKAVCYPAVKRKNKSGFLMSGKARKSMTEGEIK